MKWFLNLKTGTKVLLTFGVMVIMISISILGALLQIRSMQSTMTKIAEVEYSNAVDLAVAVSLQNEIRGNMWKLLATNDREVQQALLDEIQLISKDIDERMTALFSRDLEDIQMHERLNEYEQARTEFTNMRESEVMPRVMSGDIDGAMEISSGIQSERMDRLRQLGNDLIQDAESDAIAAIDQSNRRASVTKASFFVMWILVCVFGLATVMALHRSIAGPLLNLTAVAERVANRDLTVELSSYGRTDEVGMLTNTFSTMVGNLRKVTREVADGVSVLGSSSSEIIASSSQVAAGATETASAITETTSTVEEVKQTATMASERAKAVSDSSSRANKVAREGSEAVRETQDGISLIGEQMNAIAQSITQLSEQSQSIGTIIASVDDIAEQSNLLAVNAAIEASKAGEQGRGFVVVAQEMRNLAERSKDATRDVRRILNDIQRGVSQAGMATEQGSNAVKSGLARAEEAGRTIQTLLDTVTESAQSALQIAASSQEQLVGMEQISLAMENIRDASEQNVAATRQAEDSAQALSRLGHDLQALVAQYKV